ncbi:hypothetical protein BCR41DRAFT_388286 [Lobosporangium transversale]|uniref:Uncharacterized protein n=1 Tax=Lobosporangium transversale TaxID=64571 RepID=A0A1Y2GG46_9FUNG|nr:hypothetical protein BCR41DRAFT_388286 [Lobosporangium transversale]ORZ09782.1 hypothetical protein BCR41DRAFT_388286 [Lobosporangium transversale]|eukprot:XP_021879052.1 hypothetical protein BCR41DRAFT_388286 [Lobosporangium transversale]
MDAMDAIDNKEQEVKMVDDSEFTTSEHSVPTVGVETESAALTPSESVESSTPTASHVVEGEDTSPSTTHQTDTSSHQQQYLIPPKSFTPQSAPPMKRRPRRTGQPLHLLLQDCSKQHILGCLCKKTSEEIKAIVSDKKALATELRNYSNEFVLTSARDRVIDEVDDEGKELLKDIDPEKDVIKQRFEDETSVFKSYDDAVHDIRVDLYFEGIKPRKHESQESAVEASARNKELNTVIEIWDIYHKRIEIEPKRSGRATQSPYPGRGIRPSGPPGTRPHPYAPYRSPSAGPGPAPPHYNAPLYAGPPAMSGPNFRESRGHHRGYDRPPYREDYYPDRREDYRRPDYDRRDPRDHHLGTRPLPPGTGPMGRPDPRDMRDMRDPRDFRDRPPPLAARNDGFFGLPGGSRYDDRRRDRLENSHVPPLRGHSGPNGTSPLNPHPSLPPKPHGTNFDSIPPPHAQQHHASGSIYPQSYPPTPHQPPHMDPQGYYAAYGQPMDYSMPGQADYTGYGYTDAQGYTYPPAATAGSNWDMNAGSTGASTTGLNLVPFNSSQPGRHKAVPLPTDFMSGPSDAPRLSMPEPHEVLGRISGVIIRDAQGNIGLCQYQFTQSA